MKGWLLAAISCVLIVAGLSAGAAGWAVMQTRTQGPLTESLQIDIERGLGVGQIANRLHHAGVIRDPLLFRLTTRFHGLDAQLQAGEYEFPAGVTMVAVISKLAQGDIIQRQITIPEGLTSWQVVNRLNDLTDIAGAPLREVSVEGGILPETYAYTASESRADVLMRMEQAQQELWRELWPARAADLPYETVEKARVAASLVEKETSVPSEYPVVAGVIVNRLRRGMPLQIDASVIYALTEGKPANEGQGPLGRRLLKKDLEIDSPYNTYKNAGLPPGPIANPGRAAIEATLHPAEHDYIYFVADGTGGHVFAKTLAEHNRNVAAWRKIRRAQQD